MDNNPDRYSWEDMLYSPRPPYAGNGTSLLGQQYAKMGRALGLDETTGPNFSADKADTDYSTAAYNTLPWLNPMAWFTTAKDAVEGTYGSADRAMHSGGNPDPVDAITAMGAVMGGGGVSRVAGVSDTGSLGVFAGGKAAKTLMEKGISGPSEALALAERMKADGRTATEIYRATSDHLRGTPYAGVHYGADGLPRFEISDAPSGTLDVPNGSGGYYVGADTGDGLTLDMGDPKTTLFRRKNKWDIEQTGLSGPVIAHPELARAYPELSASEFSIKSNNKIKDNFAGLDQSGKTYVRARNRYSPATDGYDSSGDPAWIRSALAHELDHKAARAEGFAPGGNPANMTGHPDYNSGDRFYETVGIPQEGALYQKLKGEVQARNTQNRLDMSPDERRLIPPWLTQDMPFSWQIDPPTKWQSRINPYLPNALKFGGKAASENFERMNKLTKEMPTPILDEQKAFNKARNDARYSSQVDAEERAKAFETQHPNFTGARPFADVNDHVLILDGKPAQSNDFTSPWAQMAMDDILLGPKHGVDSLEKYLAGHGSRMTPGKTLDPDYQSGLFELASLTQQGRLKIVSRDAYDNFYARQASDAPELKKLPPPDTQRSLLDALAELYQLSEY